MPRYELAVIMRLLGREQKIQALKDVVKHMLNEGHNVRKIQSLGDKGLPYRFYSHEVDHVYGSYTLFDVDFRLKDLDVVERYFKNNLNVIKMTFTPYDTLYCPEPYCDGLETVDYEEKLKEIKEKKTISSNSKKFYK